MATALAQRNRRKKHKRLKRCLWCPRRAKKALCNRCQRKHRLRRRESYQTERSPGAKQYRCTDCGELGHNARRHKRT